MALTPNKTAKGGREDGAIILTFSLMLLFLIGFAAMAIDLGRLFVVRTELQTAADSCALAAAQELDGQLTAITRATSAGLTAGNLNRVDMQSADWAGQAKLAADDISFRDATYNITTASANARYVQCQHTQAGVPTLLLHAMSAFGSTNFGTSRAVAASAVASRGHAQSTCPVPIALRPLDPSDSTNFGFKPGDWVVLKGASSSLLPGQMGWYILEPTNQNSTTVLSEELSERAVCGIAVGRPLYPGSPGQKNALDAVWNQRFGLYRNNNDDTDGPSVYHPDFTGYAYTELNWPAGRAAFADYLQRRAAFAPFGTNIGLTAKALYGKNVLGNFHRVATSAEHARYGFNRRVVLVPVVSPGSAVQDFACMLMLAPLTGGSDDTKMEYLGRADALDSPCTTSGLAGGSAGPLVPVLVR